MKLRDIAKGLEAALVEACEYAEGEKGAPVPYRWKRAVGDFKDWESFRAKQDAATKARKTRGQPT